MPVYGPDAGPGATARKSTGSLGPCNPEDGGRASAHRTATERQVRTREGPGRKTPLCNEVPGAPGVFQHPIPPPPPPGSEGSGPAAACPLVGRGRRGDVPRFRVSAFGAFPPSPDTRRSRAVPIFKNRRARAAPARGGKMRTLRAAVAAGFSFPPGGEPGSAALTLFSCRLMSH